MGRAYTCGTRSVAATVTPPARCSTTDTVYGTFCDRPEKVTERTPAATTCVTGASVVPTARQPSVRPLMSLGASKGVRRKERM